MAALTALTPEALQDTHDEQRSLYEELKAHGLKLDLTRGKPAPDQLELSSALLTQPVPAKAADGTDVRNYGGLNGLTELRRIFADALNLPLDSLIAGDNSSLSLMHDVMAFAMLFGVPGGQPWVGQNVKVICPVPGYDRHFTISAGFGIEMVTVPLTETGPDMDAVRALAADPQVKGMWAVPMYSNPSGVSYDEATTRALLEMEAADDFRIWWDNAYALHHLSGQEPVPLDVITMAAEAGNPDRVFAFASTSKVTLAGAGVSFLASSPTNWAWYLGHLSRRTIGPDKVNHLRHARFLKDAAGVRVLMRRHRELLQPKFAIVRETLERRLGGTGAARWSSPRGGYFVTLEVMDGTAARVVALAKEAGIALTPAGSSHPLGDDPDDRWIRLAPTFPTQGELACAMDGVATCVLLAATEKMLGRRQSS